MLDNQLLPWYNRLRQKERGNINMESKSYNPLLHQQKLEAAWYSITHKDNPHNPNRPVSILNSISNPIGFTSKQDFYDWANDPEEPTSLAYAINERFYGDNLMAQELQLTKIHQGQPYGRCNCCWLTRSEIREREPRTVKFTYHGKEFTITDFCEMFDIKRTTMRSFIYRKGVDNLTDEMIDAFIANQRLNAKYKRNKQTQPPIMN